MEIYSIKAVKRNSNDTSECRKLLVDAKQLRMDDELALELPVEHRAFKIKKSLYVDWDGCPPLQGKDIMLNVKQRI